MRPVIWSKLYENTRAQDFRPELRQHHCLAIVVDPSKAYSMASAGPRNSFDLIAGEQYLSLDVLDQLVGLLIGLPDVLPVHLREEPRNWTAVPVHKPDNLTKRHAHWKIGDGLVVAADRDGVQLLRPGTDVSSAILDAERARALSCALASAKLWHTSIPDVCAACGVDVRRYEHGPDCGV